MTAFWTNIISSIPSKLYPVLVIFFVVFIMIYFIPWMIANARRTRNRAQVRVINIFLWLSFIGRVVALAMAYSPDVEKYEEPKSDI